MPQDERQKQKNLTLLFVLLGLAFLLFFLTLVKFGHILTAGQ